jgi:hypothetical protein
LTSLPDVLILELLRAQISERRMAPAFVVDIFDEAGKVFGDILEAFVGHRVDRTTFSVFMKLSALALSKGLPGLLMLIAMSYSASFWR